MQGYTVGELMKHLERMTLKRLVEIGGRYTTLLEVKEDCSRFDAINNEFIVEIKNRSKWFQETFIEFDKYSFNEKYAEIVNRQFLYAVQMINKIYVFNISKMNDYLYRWEWRKLPRQTEFDDRNNIKKFVGYINVDDAEEVIDLEKNK